MTGSPALPDLPKRRVLVVSDRYPPDTAGGAELSLHLMLREPALRDDVLVVTFDKALATPALREIDGVAVLGLPAPAAWPLHRLSQAEVEALKARPYGLKWPRYLAEAATHAAQAPSRRLPAFGLRLAGAGTGGVRMDHETVPESGAPAALRAAIAAVGPALVHADNARAIMVAAEALKEGGPPLVAVVRDHRFASERFDQTFNAPPAEGWRARTAERFGKAALAARQEALRKAALVVATGRNLEDRLRGVVPAGALRRAALVPVTAPYEPAPISRDVGTNLLVVGSLNANKGQAHLMEDFVGLNEQIPGLEIHFAGVGPDAGAIAALAVWAAGKARLHGMVGQEELAALYRAADIVVAPTLWEEPFGRVPLEAAVHGRPTVAYASGGHAETIIDGETGRLVRTGDRSALIRATAALARDPDARERMGLAARKRAIAAHAPNRLATVLRCLWDEALAQ